MEEPPSFILRTGILVLLCFQNSGHALLTRYSTGILKESYSSYEVVISAELIKLLVSGYISIVDRSDTDAIGHGFSKLVWLILNARKIVILVILYCLSNILSYYALARVDASVYTVLLQLKTLTTPAFAVILLNRNISSVKWRALLLLVLGCILVASPTFNTPLDCDNYANTPSDQFSASTSSKNGETISTYFDSIFGVSAILMMVTISGYASIYFESILKKQGEKITIWERNFQLAFYSIILLSVVIYWESSLNDLFSGVVDRSNASAVEPGTGYSSFYIPFRGWSVITLIITLIQAGGGLLVAASLKYTDAILKTLATCGSIVLSSFLGYLLLDGQLDAFIVIGCISTILAIFNYTLD